MTCPVYAATDDASLPVADTLSTNTDFITPDQIQETQYENSPTTRGKFAEAMAQVFSEITKYEQPECNDSPFTDVPTDSSVLTTYSAKITVGYEDVHARTGHSGG